MQKRILLAVLTMLCIMQSTFCFAAEKINEELNLPVGCIFGVKADDLKLTILQGNARIIEIDGVEQLQCLQVGDVLLNARFISPQFPGKYHDYKYLIHVVEAEELAAADKNLAQRKAEQKAAIDPAKFPQQVLDLVNAERAKFGLRSLKLSAELQRGAGIRAKEITRVLSHTRPNGQPCHTVLSSPWGVGENIAAGSATPEEVVEQWMDSPGHRANILNRQFKELGVGYCYDESGTGGYGHYWVQMFRG